MKYFSVLLVSLSFFSCSTMQTAHQSTATTPAVVEQTAPPVIVYKTKNDYANRVPVILSEDKQKIVAYPAPTDLRNGGNYLKPIALKDGYYLDQKGINAGVAFLDFTYEEYAILNKTPSKTELMAHILDKDPLSEICNCGSRQAFTDMIAEINQLISTGKLQTHCTPLK